MATDEGSKLILKKVKVVFKNNGEKGYGESLVIDADDPMVQKQITDWVVRNRVGRNGDNPGVPKFGYYPDENDPERQTRYKFKITDKTLFKGVDGLTEADCGMGSLVTLVANAYPYSGFGGGVGQSLSAVKIWTPGNGSSQRDMDIIDDEDDALE
ncbi:hypothetical protein IJJ53_01780 [Candidatus Saccharibacteria bacterium]|nr:hypothetical protein [Candidatus Saccharibacteria bacterium]